MLVSQEMSWMDLDSKHILLVDDEADFRLSMALLLERRGYQVSEASNGLHALQIISNCVREDRDIDLILTDIKMPMMTGVQFIERVRQEKEDVEIVIVTGYGDRETLSKLAGKGCNKILHKPFDEEELLGLLDVFFCRQEAV
jgi:CheY-like chemotaxis protein